MNNNVNAIPRNVATNVTTRTEVYQAINTERDFQDSFVLPERQYYQTHTLGEFILMLNQYAAQCQQKWTHHSDKEDGSPSSLHEVRKLAAIAVRCMEQHGAPLREIPKREKAKVIDTDDETSTILKQFFQKTSDDIEELAPLEYDVKTFLPKPRQKKNK